MTKWEVGKKYLSGETQEQQRGGWEGLGGGVGKWLKVVRGYKLLLSDEQVLGGNVQPDGGC